MRCVDVVNNIRNSQVLEEIVYCIRQKMGARQSTRTVFMAVSLAEILVKNCGMRLHAAIGQSTAARPQDRRGDGLPDCRAAPNTAGSLLGADLPRFAGPAAGHAAGLAGATDHRLLHRPLVLFLALSPLTRAFKRGRSIYSTLALPSKSRW